MAEGSSEGTKRPRDTDINEDEAQKRTSKQLRSDFNCGHMKTKAIKSASDFPSKAVAVHQTIFKGIRKWSDPKYDHSSPLLQKKIRVNKPVSKSDSAARGKHSVSRARKVDQSLSKTCQDSTDQKPPHLCTSEGFSIDNMDSAVETDINSIVQSYVHDLKQLKAFAPCDGSLRHFVLQDFNCDELHLKHNHYVFVSRRAIFLEDGLQWIFWCSCDQQRSHLINSLGLHVEASYKDLSEGECLHITTAIFIVEQIDAVHGLSPMNDFTDHTYASKLSEDFVSIGANQALCANVNGDFGVICLVNQGVRCVTCSKPSCMHVGHLHKIVDSTEELSPLLQMFADYLSSHSEKKPLHLAIKPVSEVKIPFSLTEDLRKICKEDFSKRFNLHNGVANLNPLPVQCSLCASKDSWSDEVAGEAFLVTPQCCYAALVSTRKCTTDGCVGKLMFDGLENGVLNMGSFCISHEVLRNYMIHFLCGRTTMYTEYTVLQKLHSDVDDQLLLNSFKYHHFRQAWYSFMQLLDIDYSRGFCCNVCGNLPSILIMDGTSLAFRRALDSWKSFIGNISYGKGRPGRFSERVFIQNVRIRSLLKAFCSTGIPVNELEELDELICRHAPSMAQLLHYLRQQIDVSLPVVSCPKPWCKFISSLSCSSAVCALVHPKDKVFTLLKKITTEDITMNPTDTAQMDLIYNSFLLLYMWKYKVGNCCIFKLLELCDMQLLQQEIPILFELLSSVSHLPQKALVPLFDTLISKSKAPFNLNSQLDNAPENKSMLEELAYFPSLPKVRARGNFEADQHTYKEVKCTKQSSGHPSLLPGIFTLFCPHGICYGFEVMRMHESPNVPFTVMYTRLQQAPSLVIYDNACNLHNYILNRAPLFFRDTWFVIDRFHWRNHTACSAGYNMDSYPQLSAINSEVVEQANSMVKRISGSVSYMTAENFMNHLKLFFWFHNREHNDKLLR